MSKSEDINFRLNGLPIDNHVTANWILHFDKKDPIQQNFN